MSPVDVGTVAPEGGDLEFGFVFADDDHAEMRADGVRLSKECLDLCRARISGDVVVVRLLAEQHVPNATTSVIGHVSGVMETLDNAASSGFERGRHSATVL